MGIPTFPGPLIYRSLPLWETLTEVQAPLGFPSFKSRPSGPPDFRLALLGAPLPPEGKRHGSPRLVLSPSVLNPCGPSGSPTFGSSYSSPPGTPSGPLTTLAALSQIHVALTSSPHPLLQPATGWTHYPCMERRQLTVWPTPHFSPHL